MKLNDKIKIGDMILICGKLPQCQYTSYMFFEKDNKMSIHIRKNKLVEMIEKGIIERVEDEKTSN
ncbi:MAG: hypothetical protein GY928_37430 [Colwellia sp.]|nr:hypothetical protein [Colwellia sp.]